MWPHLSLCFVLTQDINYDSLEMPSSLWTRRSGWLIDSVVCLVRHCSAILLNIQGVEQGTS